MCAHIGRNPSKSATNQKSNFHVPISLLHCFLWGESNKVKTQILSILTIFYRKVSCVIRTWKFSFDGFFDRYAHCTNARKVYVNIKSYLVPQIFKITKRSSKLLRNIYPCIDEADNFIIEKLVASQNCFQLLLHFMQKHLYKCQRLITLDLTSLRIGF